MHNNQGEGEIPAGNRKGNLEFTNDSSRLLLANTYAQLHRGVSQRAPVSCFFSASAVSFSR